MKEILENNFGDFFENKGKLIYTPGPTMVHPKVLQAMSKQIINPDLDPDFPEWFLETSQLIAKIIKTREEVLILPGEGMLALDAALNSVVKPNDKVLVLASGIFGHGFSDLVKKCQAKPIVLATKEYNEALNIEKVKEAIDNNPDIAAITVIHCETPSGTLNPLEEIGKICKKNNAILIVDAVSSNAGTDVRTDEWGIDINLGASQKCFSAPPGISFLSLSQKALEVINGRESIPTFYSDLSVWTKSWIKDRTLPFTHSISDLYAFRESIDLILVEGLENVFKRHDYISRALIAACESIGLKLFPKNHYIVSPTVSVFKTPQGIDSTNLLMHLWKRYGVLLAGAWGSILGGKVIRLGNMGYGANPHFAIIALTALEKTLIDFGLKIKTGTAAGIFMDHIYK
ncbi:MAG: alanine--glyoxylate aminotransferase family protein [Candidatus Heimdallarchaeota archaeon]|nr:alanine--glyoxylate aminotransferase family protein [Candidatus Heimdallarchaeota archaeon]